MTKLFNENEKDVFGLVKRVKYYKRLSYLYLLSLKEYGTQLNYSE